MFKYLTLPADAPNLDKDTIWRRLGEMGLLAPVVIAGRKGKDAMRPIIATKTTLDDILISKCPTTIPSFQEAYDISSLNAYLARSPHRQTNSAIVQEYFNQILNWISTNQKRGKRSNEEKASLQQIQSLANKHKAMEDSASTIGDKLITPNGPPPKRLRRKQSQDCVQ